MYSVIYKKKALKALTRLPRATAERFQSAFVAIAGGKYEGFDIKPMNGCDGFRLRIGPWRAVYEIDNGALVIYVMDVGSREDIYK